MTVTWIPQACGWDGPNDEWLPSDDSLTNFLIAVGMTRRIEVMSEALHHRAAVSPVVKRPEPKPQPHPRPRPKPTRATVDPFTERQMQAGINILNRNHRKENTNG